MASAITEDAIIAATNELFREFGFNGTSMKQIVARSKATTGSIYHFFPNGKDQLAEQVIRVSGGFYQALIESILDESSNIADAIFAVFEQAAVLLENTDYIDPCPIGGIAREVASRKPELRDAVAQVFSSWSEMIGERLRAGGLSEEAAADTSIALVGAIEGGFVLSRTDRSPEPLRKIGRAMQQLVVAQLHPVGEQKT